MSDTERQHVDVAAGSGPAARVAVAGGAGPYANVEAALARIDLACVAGRRVLVKPNCGRMAAPGGGINTHPEAVAAVVDCLRRAGAEVSVGESPISGVNTLEALEMSGIAAVVRARGVPLLDLDARPYVEVEIPHGRAIRKLKVCAEVLEHDLVVSLPVMKMHMHTGVSLGVKNMKGCLWRRSKVKLHMLPPVPGCDQKPIDVAIAEMLSVLRPHLVVVDGYVALQGLGPSAGEGVTLDVALAGREPLAVDSVACELMGVDPGEVAHLRIAAERGWGTISPEEADVVPAGWRRWRRVLEPPPGDLAFAFPGVVVHDENSCSACQSTLLMFLRRYLDELREYLPPGEEAHFAIGKGNARLPPGTICLGNCTARHRRSQTFLPGCPPVASQILRAISGRDVEDEKDGRSQDG